MGQLRTFDGLSYKNFSPSKLGRLGIQYTRCKVEKSALTESKIRGLVLHDSKVLNATCTDTSFEHFVADGRSSIDYSHFTGVKFYQSGAFIDCNLTGNIFNSVLFHNLHITDTFFMANAFINCVFANCLFNDSVFSNSSFSGTLFYRNTIRSDKSHKETSRLFANCDFKPNSVLGPWEGAAENYGKLADWIVRDNLRVINTGIEFNNCKGLNGLKSGGAVPKDFTTTDFNYSSVIARPAHPSTGETKITLDDTQPIRAIAAPPSRDLRPCRYMSEGL